MKRREFLRNAAIVAASSGIATDVMAAENLLSPIPSPSPEGESKKAESLIDSEPVLQNYAATSMGIAFSVTDWANGYVIYGEKPDLSDGKRVWCGGYRMTALDNEVSQVRLTGLKPNTLYYYKIGADRINYKDGYHMSIIGNEEKPKTYSFRTAGEGAKSHFCVINDTHAKWEAIDPAINKIMELQPSCVIWNGDATNCEETIADQKRIFFKPNIERKDYAANIPYLFCPGNHDERGMANRHLERVWMFRQPEERRPFDWDLGRNFAVRMGDIALIGLDTAEDKLDSNPLFANLFQSGPYRMAQKRWLKDALKRPEIASAPYLVAFCHIPLYDPRENVNPGDLFPADIAPNYEGDFAEWQRTSANLWGPLLEEAGCHMLITAHQHRYRLDMPNEKHSWYQIVGGGPHMKGLDGVHFATVIEGEVKDGKLVISVHNLCRGEVYDKVTFSNPR